MKMKMKMKMIWRTVKGAGLTVKMAKLLPCAVHFAPLILMPILQVAEVLLLGSRQKKEKAVFQC